MESSKVAPNLPNSWTERGARYAASEVHKFGPSLPKLLALARPCATDICLDVGAGSGHTAAGLARFGGKVYGLDPAEGMLEAARESYGGLENLEFVSGTGEATGFPAATFDIVTARHTLHHHADVKATLSEVARVLKPGGRFALVDEITPSAEVEVWYHALETTRDPTHVRAYTLAEWRAFIKGAGLMWVVGDAETVYELKAESWIERVSSSPAQTEAVRQLFRDADENARRVFNIRCEGQNAAFFDMPMALILAVKQE
jgi:ubiquinone/menaquinone biosynthesis C-methylase UbiE